MSRNNTQSLELFGLGIVREGGEWQLIGDQSLLLLERRVHQVARLRQMSGMPLRIEANLWAAPSFLEPLPEGWERGVWDHVGMARPLQLVRERVIDAWIGSYQPDLPDDDADLCVIDLCATAVHLVAALDHPLVRRDVLNEPSIQTLLLRLRQRSLDLSERHPELVPLGPGRDSPHLGIKNPARREQEGSQ